MVIFQIGKRKRQNYCKNFTRSRQKLQLFDSFLASKTLLYFQKRGVNFHEFSESGILSGSGRGRKRYTRGRATARLAYKQVVEQITYDSQVEDYAKTYSNMKPQEAASIFDTMTDNLGLVADILMNMGTQQRADILGKMDFNGQTCGSASRLFCSM